MLANTARSPMRASPSIAISFSTGVRDPSCDVRSTALDGWAIRATASSAASASPPWRSAETRSVSAWMPPLMPHRPERLHRDLADRPVLVVQRDDDRVADILVNRIVAGTPLEQPPQDAEREETSLQDPVRRSSPPDRVRSPAAARADHVPRRSSPGRRTRIL